LADIFLLGLLALTLPQQQWNTLSWLVVVAVETKWVAAAAQVAS
jgi:hypothetical protein